MTEVLRTEKVSKVYQTSDQLVIAVNKVSIDINAGEFVALVGPSGSGKTTMLALLAALLNPSEGKVIIAGEDIGKMSEAERGRFRREKIGFTFQSNNLVPYLTVLENVELMLRLNGALSKDCTKKAKDLLSRLGLADRLNYLPGQLSGGQRQRVAIARSLIHGPSLVLADEPTASLDTERAYQAIDLFSTLIHEEKKAGIMVTHDLRMTKYVDKVIQMVDGELDRVLVDRSSIDALAGVDPLAQLGEPVPIEISPEAFKEPAAPLLTSLDSRN